MANSDEIAAAKKLLRKVIKERKSQYSLSVLAEKSDAVFTQVEQLPAFVTSTCIFAYMAMADEVQTQRFIRKWVGKKRVVLPVVKGDDLELREYSSEDSLVAGQSFGIMEPIEGRLVLLSEIDLAIIPGVAFDRTNNRMGRGKGYYDKLLNSSCFYKVGVCFDFQLVDVLPVDTFDEKMDTVVIA